MQSLILRRTASFIKTSIMFKSILQERFLISGAKKIFIIILSFFSSHSLYATDWFVNDASTTGDVFTTNIGNDANPGTASAPFATLNAAIAIASAGDVIYVDAGTYTGDVNITKPLTLRGAKFGIPAGPAASPAGRGTNETIITAGAMFYAASVDDITVDGFTVNVGTGLYGIVARGLNSVVINNIVTGIVNPLILQTGIATRANAPLRVHSYLIRNNNVTGCRTCIFFDGNLENPSEISFNYAAGGSTSGFQITGSSNHTFRANVAENNTQGLILTKGNTIIEQNTFRNNSFAGIKLAGTADLSGNNIQFNFFENNLSGIALTNPNAGAVNNQAHYNSFTGNVANIASEHAANFDATCNWYGTTDLPTITASITGPVTFIPYLNDGIDSDPVTPGFQPTTTCVVPVSLTGFSATVKNYDVILNWQTALEVNSSHFLIERSTNQQQFTEVGRVVARGFSENRVNYTFTDNKPTAFDRPVFYRLKMVDRDGTYKYSKILSVVLKTSGTYAQNVYPSPAKAGSGLYSNVIAAEPQDIQFSLVNATGQVILQKQARVSKGMNQLNFRLPVNAAGIHYLLIRSEDKVQKVPVMIY